VFVTSALTITPVDAAQRFPGVRLLNESAATPAAGQVGATGATDENQTFAERVVRYVLATQLKSGDGTIRAAAATLRSPATLRAIPILVDAEAVWTHWRNARNAYIDALHLGPDSSDLPPDEPTTVELRQLLKKGAVPGDPRVAEYYLPPQPNTFAELGELAGFTGRRRDPDILPAVLEGLQEYAAAGGPIDLDATGEGFLYHALLPGQEPVRYTPRTQMYWRNLAVGIGGLIRYPVDVRVKKPHR
jgi:hypothetical protein